jgi:5'-methylthioadenosine phosphorylase
MSLAIIGGTGLCALPGWDLAPETVATPYGDVMLRRGTVGGRPLLFLARHGERHGTPPHAINYRANIAALKAAGATAVVASSAVGTLTEAVPPGSLALLADFIDATSGRAATFFDDRVVHLDSSEPYCPTLRAALSAAAAQLGIGLAPAATYLCTNGPRFETKAEIRAGRGWGADLVGMTNVPEVTLAREAELCYAAVAIATNWAAGLAGQPLSHGEVEQMMVARLAELGRLLAAVAGAYKLPDCGCRHALDEYRRKGAQP